MPPSRRSSSSHRSSGPSHRSSSSHRSSGPSHHSNSSHTAFGGTSYRSSSHSYHNYDHSYGAGASGLFHNLSGLSHDVDPDSSYGVFDNNGKSFRNTKSAGGSYHPHRRKDLTYGNGTYRSDSFIFQNADSPIVLNRIMEHQPQGYPVSNPDYPTLVQYHCEKHDYIFYGKDWYDNKSRTTYTKGFYDEDGILHPNIYLTGEDHFTEQLFVCPYCKSEIKISWKTGAKPSCPNCCAQLEEIETDVVLDRFVINSPKSGSQTHSPYKLIITVMVIMSVFSTCLTGITQYISRRTKSPKPDLAVTAPVSATQIQHNNNTIYVDEIGRNCNWLSSADSYYDPVTDCYFVYVDNLAVPTWQYWYEEISSDFGDCGWMEFDEKKQKWYIEKSENTWVPLPEKYDTDDLWHIKEY